MESGVGADRVRWRQGGEMSPPESDNLVEVWTCWGEPEAEFFKTMLKSFGIESVFRGESTRLTHPVTVSKLAEVRILVRAEDAIREAC